MPTRRSRRWFSPRGWLRLAGAGAVIATQFALAAPAQAHHVATSNASFGTRFVENALTGTRALNYIGVFLLVGGAAFLAIAWPQGATVGRARRVLWISWGFALATSITGIALRGAMVEGHGIGGIFNGSVFANTLDTDFGRAWAIKAFVLLLAVPLLRAIDIHRERAVTSGWWRVAGAAVAVGVLRSLALNGHAQTGRVAWIGSIAILIHLIGLALWLGGLGFLTICVLPRRKSDELETVVPRFSTLAGAAVASIVVAGGFLLWQEVGTPSALFSTGYGRALLVKFAIFGLILLAAQRSRKWVQERLDVAVLSGGTQEVVRPFAISVGSETALAIAALAVMGVVVGLTPPA